MIENVKKNTEASKEEKRLITSIKYTNYSLYPVQRT